LFTILKIHRLPSFIAFKKAKIWPEINFGFKLN